MFNEIDHKTVGLVTYTTFCMDYTIACEVVKPMRQSFVEFEVI